MDYLLVSGKATTCLYGGFLFIRQVLSQCRWVNIGHPFQGHGKFIIILFAERHIPAFAGLAPACFCIAPFSLGDFSK